MLSLDVPQTIAQAISAEQPQKLADILRRRPAANSE
jgi:hypothetical protein